MAVLEWPLHSCFEEMVLAGVARRCHQLHPMSFKTRLLLLLKKDRVYSNCLMLSKVRTTLMQLFGVLSS